MVSEESITSLADCRTKKSANRRQTVGENVQKLQNSSNCKTKNKKQVIVFVQFPAVSNVAIGFIIDIVDIVEVQ